MTQQEEEARRVLLRHGQYLIEKAFDARWTVATLARCTREIAGLVEQVTADKQKQELPA